MVGPAKMPAALVRQLNEAVTRAKQSAEVKQQLARVGAIAVDMSPAELGAFLQRDHDKWTKVLRTAGIKPE